MYGTVDRIKAKAGQDKALVAFMDDWEKTRGPKARGTIAGYPYKLDQKPGEYVMVTVFQNKATYTANAQAPEQDAWYRKFRPLLDADPVREDGEIVSGDPVKV